MLSVSLELWTEFKICLNLNLRQRCPFVNLEMHWVQVASPDTCSLPTARFLLTTKITIKPVKDCCLLRMLFWIVHSFVGILTSSSTTFHSWTCSQEMVFAVIRGLTKLFSALNRLWRGHFHYVVASTEKDLMRTRLSQNLDCAPLPLLIVIKTFIKLLGANLR